MNCKSKLAGMVIKLCWRTARADVCCNKLRSPLPKLSGHLRKALSATLARDVDSSMRQRGTWDSTTTSTTRVSSSRGKETFEMRSRHSFHDARARACSLALNLKTALRASVLMRLFRASSSCHAASFFSLRSWCCESV